MYRGCGVVEQQRMNAKRMSRQKRRAARIYLKESNAILYHFLHHRCKFLPVTPREQISAEMIPFRLSSLQFSTICSCRASNKNGDLLLSRRLISEFRFSAVQVFKTAGFNRSPSRPIILSATYQCLWREILHRRQGPEQRSFGATSFSIIRYQPVQLAHERS